MSSEKMPSAVREGKPGSSMYPESSLGEAVEGIPTGREVDWEPLVDYRRNGVSETTIHGAVAWAHGDEVLIWRQCALLWKIHDEAIYAQSFTEELQDATLEQKQLRLHHTMVILNMSQLLNLYFQKKNGL